LGSTALNDFEIEKKQVVCAVGKQCIEHEDCENCESFGSDTDESEHEVWFKLRARFYL